MLKQAIIFGGSGFLGSHVADSLSISGHKVTIFDKKDTLLAARSNDDCR